MARLNLECIDINKLFMFGIMRVQKKGVAPVSPGPLTPKQYFQRVAHSGHYLLPHYVSGLIVASNIKLFYPGLGTWNSSENGENIDNVLHVLMKYTYAQVLTGGVGPFNFETKDDLTHKFQLKRQSGGLLITVPGGQVIGYILKTVPKFPEDQTGPDISPIDCQESSLPPPPSRKRRSVSDDKGYIKKTTNIKELARDLFSEGLRDSNTNIGSLTASSRNIEQLIRKSNLKMDQLSQFIENMEKMRDSDSQWKNLGAVNQTEESFS